MRLWQKIGLGLVGVFVVVVAAREVHHAVSHPVTAASRLAAHPQPRLFGQAAVASYAGPLDQQAATARRLMQGWWSAHGTKPQDAQFGAWLKKALPAPPSEAERKAEAKQLEKLVEQRTAKGRKAAHWLQSYGGRTIWLAYAHKQSAHLPKAEQKRRHRELEKALHLAKHLDNQLTTSLKLQSPALLDPALRTHKGGAAVAGKKGCPCSYPASAAADSAAARTVLGYLFPQQARQYTHMVDELAYAEVYSGRHLPSDVNTGVLLGDMVGEYVLVTRHEAQPQQVTAALAGG